MIACLARWLALALSCLCACAQASDWLQFGKDAQHSGNNAEEAGYSTPGNALAYAITLPWMVDSAPILVSGATTTSGVRDVLFLVATNGSLFAIDSANGSVIWTNRALGAATLTQSSPAVDPARQFVYAYGFDGKVHKYNVGDGGEILVGGWPQLVTRKPQVDKVASALSIATAANGHTYLYVVTDSYYDAGDYQGHIVSIDLGDGTRRIFNPQCSSFNMLFVADGTTSGAGQNDCAAVPSGRTGENANSGIWGRAGAVYQPALDRVLFTTGNGAFDPTNAGGHGMYWGDSVLAMHADGSGGIAGLPVDSYTPTTFNELLANDADLGSSSPALLPSPVLSRFPHLAVQGGKDGCLRLLNLDDLSGTGGPGQAGGELQVMPQPGYPANQCDLGQDAGAFLRQPAVWVDPLEATTWVFMADRAVVVAYSLAFDGAGYPSLLQRWTINQTGTSPVVANGAVYFATAGNIQSVDARSGMSLWSTDQYGSIHWQSPIVVNGALYVVDQSGKLWKYRLDGIFRGGFD